VTATFTLNLLFYGFRLTENREFVLPQPTSLVDATVLVALVNCAALVWLAVVLRREAVRADSVAAPRSSPAPC